MTTTSDRASSNAAKSGSAGSGDDGGGNGRRRTPLAWWRGKPKRKRRIIVALLLVPPLILIAAAGLFYAIGGRAAAAELNTAQVSTITYRDGKTEIVKIGSINRTSVPLSKVSVAAQHAVLAAEDKEFYSESGHLLDRHPARPLGRHPRPGDHAGWIDDHPAVREERLPVVRALFHAQAERDRHRDEAGQEVQQGPDPRVLPEHDLSSVAAPTASRPPLRPTSASRPRSSRRRRAPCSPG